MQTDKRIIKTRTNIKSAFMDMVKDTDIGKISVSALAAKALVNRSTFYLHYKDVSAVADDVENEIAETISAYIGDFTISDIYGSTMTLFRKLTARLDENVKMKDYIFFSTNSVNAVSKLKLIFVNKTLRLILKKFPGLKEEDIIYPLTYAAAGIVDSYMKWVRTGDITIDELIGKTGKITERIIEQLTNA